MLCKFMKFVNNIFLCCFQGKKSLMQSMHAAHLAFERFQVLFALKIINIHEGVMILRPFIEK